MNQRNIVKKRPEPTRVRGAALSALLLLGLGGATAGCGETNFVEVTLMVPATQGIDVPCLISMVNSCEVTVSGAASDQFTLRTAACAQLRPTMNNIGLFRYGVDKDSGDISFHVELFDGNLTQPPLAQGDGTATIKSGARATVTVNAAPRTTFTCTP